MSITERELPAVGGSHHKLQTCVNHTSNCGTENAFVRFCIDVHAPRECFSPTSEGLWIFVLML